MGSTQGVATVKTAIWVLVVAAIALFLVWFFAPRPCDDWCGSSDVMAQT